MTVYGYCRVSTDRQADEGQSLGAQQRAIEGYAMMLGLSLGEVFIERGVSGAKPLTDRPEGARLLDALQPGDSVIAAKLDRMFRSAADALAVCAQIKERGVSLHLIDLGGDVTGNGISKLVFTILAAVAEAERERIRERVVDMKADQRARGRYLGGKVPFGYMVQDGELRPVPAEQRVIQGILDMHQQNHSLRRIAAWCETMTYPLTHMGVSKIIARHLPKT